MKTVLCIIILILAALLCGCTTVPPQAPGGASPAPAAPGGTAPVPSLLGNWTGTMRGYIGGVGYTEFPNETITVLVTEQHGRIFSGRMVFTPVTPGEEPKEFAGVIDRDGRTIHTAEQHGGYGTGTLVSANEIDLIYVDSAAPYNVAIDSLKRS
jgi:hypothetical protein